MYSPRQNTSRYLDDDDYEEIPVQDYRRRPSDGPIVPPTVVMYNKEMLRQQRLRNTLLASGFPPSPHSGHLSPHRSGQGSGHHTPGNGSRKGSNNSSSCSCSCGCSSVQSLSAPTPKRLSGAVAATPKRVHAAAKPTTLPAIVITATKDTPGRPRMGSAASPLARTRSFQVAVRGAETDATPIPENYLVMFCHRCYRFGCDARRPGQTGENTACPACRHQPVEVPSTRRGLIAAYKRAATQHSANGEYLTPLQMMMSLHCHTHGRIVLFPSRLPQMLSRCENKTPTGRDEARPFIDDRRTVQQVAYTFKSFSRNAPETDAKCVVCLSALGAGENHVVKLEGCGHVFHAACVKQWIAENNLTCPMCRTPMIERS